MLRASYSHKDLINKGLVNEGTRQLFHFTHPYAHYTNLQCALLNEREYYPPMTKNNHQERLSVLLDEWDPGSSLNRFELLLDPPVQILVLNSAKSGTLHIIQDPSTCCKVRTKQLKCNAAARRRQM
ncbi:hypothetical protein TNCT_629161 [Trichonephila clavata]|uniref:Uncharacterized protein n=1 Tax=Trichonephila clavata TaxID=2740835 RepID=A0A8X6G2E6_TRICU|nr:hypothetical protein TNCT_629161 [Trichonephila clavata]